VVQAISLPIISNPRIEMQGDCDAFATWSEPARYHEVAVKLLSSRIAVNNSPASTEARPRQPGLEVLDCSFGGALAVAVNATKIVKDPECAPFVHH
jgi:hypothetical protein